MRIVVIALFFLWACSSSPTEPPPPPEPTPVLLAEPAAETIATVRNLVDTVPVPVYDYDTTEWLEVIALDSSIRLDIRYATANNFVGEVMYACGRCFLRPPVARAIVKIHRELREQGLGLKMYDCYRPRDVQWKLWRKVPDPRFVADPRKGSVHNRGGAVDLTIVDEQGAELPMGTDYDYFGREAYQNYTNLPDSVLANRRLLRTIMAKYSFAPISTEWWHYNYRSRHFPIADKEWNCPADSAQ